MHVRKRTRVLPGVEGFRANEAWSTQSKQWVRTGSWTSSPLSLSETMEDVVGNHKPDVVNPVIQEKLSRDGGLITGTRTAGFTRYVAQNYCPPYFATMILSHLSVANIPSNAWVATEVASQTNPSNYSFNLPVSLAELKDIPRMMQKKILSQKGNSVIEHAFGWSPIIQDLQAMFQIIRSIETRLKTLEMLGKGKLSRTRVAFSGNSIQNQTSTVTLNSSGWTATSTQRKTETNVSIFGTASWRPNFPISPLTDEAKWKLALRLAAGLEPTIVFDALYQLMPWSWLIDYFSNLGDLISLTNNSVASLSGPVSVSTKTVTTFRSNVNVPSTMSGTAFRAELKGWTRIGVNPGLEFRMPILTTGQLSILNNLANSLGK